MITFPLITTIDTRLLGHPFGDAYEYTHHIWWIKTALATGQNPFFMPNIVYPDGASAILLWSLPLQSFPAWLFAFALPLPAAFNLTALLTLALNGWAMFWLARRLLAALPPGRDQTLAALGAGLAFMLAPAFQGQLGAAHTGLLTLWPAPLYLGCLLHLRASAHPRRTIAAGALLFAVSLWGSILLLIYLIAPITALVFVQWLQQRDWRTLRRALVTVILGGLLALPFAVPLAVETLRTPPATGVVTYSASALGFAAPSFYHPLFAGLDYSRRILGIDPFEQAGYVGVIAAGLAALALLAGEYQFWWPLPTINGVVPAPIAALAERSDLRAVLDIPVYHPLVNKDGMFLQTGHHLPMIGGQITRESPVNPAKVALLQDTLDPALLDAAGVDVVILHKEYDEAESAVGAFTRARLGTPFYEDNLYAAFLVPAYSGDPPGLTTYADGVSLYFYAPQAGQAALVGQVDTEAGRAAQVALDGAALADPGTMAAALRVPVTFAAGYHTLTVSLDPACPAADDAALRCPPLTVTGLALEAVRLKEGA